MTALSRRNFEDAFALATRRDRHALRWSGSRRARARSVDVAGQRVSRHVQVAAEEWDGGRKRMADFGGVRFAPCAIGERSSAGGELRDREINGVENGFVPR